MSKRIFAAAVAAVALSLTACGGAEENVATENVEDLNLAEDVNMGMDMNADMNMDINATDLNAMDNATGNEAVDTNTANSY
jgi:hypothetical protein